MRRVRSPAMVAARSHAVRRVRWSVGLLLAAGVTLPGRGAAQEAVALYPPRARLVVAEAAGGAVGAAGGMVAGVGLVLLAQGEPQDFVDWLDGSRIYYSVLAAVAGSIGGGALGSHAGARLAGGRGGRWSDRALRQAAGFAVGLVVAGQLTKHTADPDDFTIVASITVTQGVVAALFRPMER